MYKIFAVKGERIYLDANVLVYYFYSKQNQRFHIKAKKLLEKIENKKYEGIISSLTLMELIKSLRELLIKYSGIRRMDDVEKIVRDSISKLFTIRNMYFMVGYNEAIPVLSETKELYYNTVSKEAFDIMCNCSGKCDYAYNSGEIEHKGLHAPDVFHVVLAKKCKCDKLATFEWNFLQTKNEISPIVLQDSNAYW